MQVDYDKVKRIYEGLKEEIEDCNSSYAFDTSEPNTYSAKINGVPILTLGDRVCFGSLLNKYAELDDDSKSIFSCKIYVNTVPRRTSQHKDRVQDNLTWMTKEQLEEHIRYIKNLGIKFGFNVRNYYRGWHKFLRWFREPDGYCVKITTIRCITTYPELKYLLFWIRQAYRYPYCINLADSYTLKEKYLPEEDMFNLVTLPGAYYGPSNENFPTCCSFVSKEYLLQELGKRRKDISEIYKRKYGYSSLYTSLTSYRGINTTAQLNNENRWENYMKVYKFIMDKTHGDLGIVSKR